MIEDVDLIVIGSGQGGVPLAADVARSGKRVVLFERDKLGGTCVNVGCTPSKAFLASAHWAARARAGAPLGVHCEVRVDVPAIMRRVNAIRGEWRTGVGEKLQAAGVRVVHAEAKFIGERTVHGGETTVRAPHVLIDTGTRPLVPPIDGLSRTPFLTNINFFDQTTLPPRMIVLGGGYIGLELGQGAQRLGTQVDVIEPHTLLKTEERESIEVLRAAFLADGMRVHEGKHAVKVRYDDRFHVTLHDGGVLEAEALLVATGRVPNTVALDAHASGIDLDDRGFVRVDAQLQSTCPGVYALGEVAGQAAFTHVAWEDYRRVKDAMAGGMRTRFDRVLGYSTFTEPQLGRVGYTAEQAQAAGYEVHVATRQLADDARGIEWNLTQGFYRIVVDAKTHRILGATCVGYEASEIVHVLLAHIMNGATWHVLEQSVHIHPTFCEALPTTVRQLADEHIESSCSECPADVNQMMTALAVS